MDNKIETVVEIARRRNSHRAGFANAELVARENPEMLQEIMKELDWAVCYLNNVVAGRSVGFEVDPLLIHYSTRMVEVLRQEKVILPTVSQVLAQSDFGSLRKGVEAFEGANDWKFLDKFQGEKGWAGMAPGVFKIYLQSVYPQVKKEGAFLASALEEVLAIGVIYG